MLRKCYQKCVGLIIKIPYLRPSKLSKDWLDDILDIFFNYFNVMKGVFCKFWVGRVPEKQKTPFMTLK